jgi:two-component system, chemotaxis family, protein-glutamate methylesterase/glutaminase
MAQFEEMEKTVRSAVRCLNERAEFCRQMAEGDPSESPGSSADWEAAGKQALERAYELREFVERDWILPAPDRS